MLLDEKSGKFNPTNARATLPGPGLGLCAFDFNKDGAEDLFVTTHDEACFFFASTGGLVAGPTYSNPGMMGPVALLNSPRDSRPDLVALNENKKARIFRPAGSDPRLGLRNPWAPLQTARRNLKVRHATWHRSSRSILMKTHRHIRVAAGLLLAVALAGGARAANTNVSVEDLPRHVYDGANGVKVVMIHYAEQNWTEVDPVAIFGEKDSPFKEICFEAKFDAFTGQAGIKLVGVHGTIQFEDRSKRKAAPELKALDNVWVCGTLQVADDGRTQQMLIYDLLKLPPDAQRFENRFQTLEHSGSAQGLIDLGQSIDRTVRNNKSDGLMGYERLIGLRDKAWMTAIQLKELVLPRDANGCYEIATMYRELLHRSSQYRTWVLKALEIDPDHGNAGKDAEANLRMRRRGDRWMTIEELEGIEKISKSRRPKCRTKAERTRKRGSA